jgi:signal transduction histidine kinase
MIIPEIPKNEAERLQELQDYQILDTAPEDNFDEITQLATEICDTPISLITLLDPDRQWFKSRHGLSQTETPRQQAFCAHAINNPNTILEVQDARLDKRFADNPLVKNDPNIVFYTGVPLVSPQGYALGTLCVIDHKPKILNATQLHSLKVLANQVVKLFELRKSNRTLIETQKKLEKTNEELIQLNHLASHDLREPLRMISGFMGLLKRDYASALDEDGKKYIDIALDGSKRMNQLIVDILDHSSVGKEDAIKESVDLSILLEEVKQNLTTQVDEAKATIKIVGQQPTLSASKTDMISLFQNLISNAIKFKAEGKPPVITISSEEKSGFWYFAIADNGLGIADHNHKKIFGMFNRLHKKSEIAGTGLGLAICEKIVLRHGGEIWVSSKLGEGSVFHFTLAK